MTDVDDDGRHRLNEQPGAEPAASAPTWVPERKVASGAIGGALAIVLLWGIGPRKVRTILIRSALL